jgi:CheY-like chemotaxis protein
MLLKGKRIFIVEDNSQNRVVFQMTLMRQGATIHFERWGTHTLFNLKSAPRIDAIILDLMLAHDISGFDIYDEIRAAPEFDHIPIVAVSAMDPSIAIPQVREKGFSGFIAKPIDNVLFPKQMAQIIMGENVWSIGERRII